MPENSSTEFAQAVVLVLAVMAVVIGVLLVRLIVEATRALATYNAVHARAGLGGPPRTGQFPRPPQTGSTPYTGSIDIAPVPPENPHAPPTPALGVPRQGVTRPFKPPSAP